MGVGLKVAGLLVHVDPQQAREEIHVDSLRIIIAVTGCSLVTHRAIEIAIRAKMQVTAVVPVMTVPLLDQDQF